MTKEEKIKEAWGVYFEHFGEHATKHALENNGYCSVPSITLGLILRSHGEEWLETDKDLKRRPKSLQGIEDNNGWIENRYLGNSSFVLTEPFEKDYIGREDEEFDYGKIIFRPKTLSCE